MKKLTFAVVAAALAWAGFWFWSANAQKTAITAWFEDRQRAGWVAGLEDLSVRGFPNRLDTTLTAPRLGNSAGSMIWETAFLQILRLSYDPSHLIFVWDNTQTFTTPTQTINLQTTGMRASAELASTANWQPERVIVVAQGLQATSTADWSLSADVAQLSLEARADTPSTYRFGVDARGLGGVLPGWVNQDGSATLDRLTVDADITLTEALSGTARPQPSQIQLHLAQANWDGIELAATGDLDITNAGTPLGRITLQLRNWREAIAKERQGDRLSAGALNQIEFTLGLIAGLSGNPETLDLPFDFRDGQIWLGPLNLGPAPRITLP